MNNNGISFDSGGGGEGEGRGMRRRQEAGGRMQKEK